MSDFDTYVYIKLPFEGKTPSSGLTPVQSSEDEQHVHIPTTSMVQDYTQNLYPVKPESFWWSLLLNSLLSFPLQTNSMCIAPRHFVGTRLYTAPLSCQTRESLKHVFFLFLFIHHSAGEYHVHGILQFLDSSIAQLFYPVKQENPWWTSSFDLFSVHHSARE